MGAIIAPMILPGMKPFRLSVLSDIHGNRWALEAVLKDIARRGVENVVNLGDSLYGPLDPAGTADILIDRNIPSVRGNEDRIILEQDGPSEASPSVEFTRQSLGNNHRVWLESLPETDVQYGIFFLCHGTPEKDSEYLIREVHRTGVSLRKPQDIQKSLRFIRSPVILCGHDHLPGIVALPDGRLVINPGSIGLPAYSDLLPHAHVMQAGSPHARYSVVTEQNGDFMVENVALPYDWNTASRTALRNGRPEWAEWLATGRAALSEAPFQTKGPPFRMKKNG